MSVHVSTLVWKCQPLKGADLLCALALADMANDEGYCWPGLRSLAERLRCQPEAVRRSVRRLEEAGYLRAEARVRENGSKTSNGYHLSLPLLEEGGHPSWRRGTPLSEERCPPLLEEGCPPSWRRGPETSSEPSSETSPNVLPLSADGQAVKAAFEAALRAGFERWWAVYPKKRDKAGAWKAWLKIAPDDASTDSLIAIVQQQMEWADWKKSGGQFIPYPATWLNGEKWADVEQVAVKRDPNAVVV